MTSFFDETEIARFTEAFSIAQEFVTKRMRLQGLYWLINKK